MKTSSVLTRMIPTLGAVRGAGVFNVAVAGMAPAVADELRRAANDDLIAVDALSGALDRLAAATAFEAQQAALADALEQADVLLGAIASGDVAHIDRARPAVADIAARIAADVASIQDVFRPSVATLRRIRADASEMSALVDAEIREGKRPEDHAIAAARVYDLADRLEDVDHATRSANEDGIATNVRLLAA